MGTESKKRQDDETEDESYEPDLSIVGVLTRMLDPDKDGTRQRSGNKRVIRIAIILNKHNYIITMSDPQEIYLDIEDIMELPDFNRWLGHMGNGGASYAQPIRLADNSVEGIKNYLLSMSTGPSKKPGDGGSEEQNMTRAQRRAYLDNLFAHIKKWKRMRNIHKGTAEKFRAELNGICGMYNKRMMWQDGTYHYWNDKIRTALNT